MPVNTFLELDVEGHKLRPHHLMCEHFQTSPLKPSNFISKLLRVGELKCDQMVLVKESCHVHIKRKS